MVRMGKASASYRLFVYGATGGACLLLAVFRGAEFLSDKAGGIVLPERATLEARPFFTKENFPGENSARARHRLFVYGPLVVPKAPARLSFELAVRGLRLGIIEGEASLLRAEQLERGRGLLLSPREMNRFFQVNLRRKKRKILEEYSYSFRFWREFYGTVPHEKLLDSTRITLEHPGRYYFILETDSDGRNPDRSNFLVKTRPAGASFYFSSAAFLFFFGLFAYNAWRRFKPISGKD